MLLRPYQEAAVTDASNALDKHGNTIVVAPTGAGKTIMLSALVGKRFKDGKKILVIQHRDELVNQNKDKFERINPNITTSIVNGTVKCWNGDSVFSMIQTISRDRNLW
jgi:superfamily II DNA or RNA helicase